MKTLYELLGTEPEATPAQIEQAYKRRLDHYLARQGIGKPNEETRRMQTIREAYLLLCLPQRRQVYDQQLKLYQKACSHLSNRGNRMRAALLMVAALAFAAGVYLHRMQGVELPLPADQHGQSLAHAMRARLTAVLRSHSQ